MANTAESFAALMQIPGLQELLNSQITSARQQEPLRTGATQTALGMLPNSSFGGSSVRPDVSAIPHANFATPPPSGSSGLAQALKYLAAAGGGALAGNALSGGNALGALIDGIKKLVGRGQTSNPFGGNTTVSNNYDPFGFDPNDPLGGGVDYGSLPGFGTPLPEANPYQNLPGYGTPLPGLGGDVPDNEQTPWWGE